MLYGKRYIQVLATGDAHELQQLKPEMCRHVMKSMATLAKFSGCYDEWRKIKERYQLKWSNGDSLWIFEEMLNGKSNYEEMRSWFKLAVESIPKPYSKILHYGVLTGLRPTETLLSLALLQKGEPKYHNKERNFLEHYRFPDFFIRRTKRAYISLANDRVLSEAKDAGVFSYMGLQSILVRNGVPSHTRFCRKLFATHLRMKGIEQELIDLLQGRTPKSIFARHYFRPTFENEQPRIEMAIESLAKELDID